MHGRVQIDRMGHDLRHGQEETLASLALQRVVESHRANVQGCRVLVQLVGTMLLRCRVTAVPTVLCGSPAPMDAVSSLCGHGWPEFHNRRTR